MRRVGVVVLALIIAMTCQPASAADGTLLFRLTDQRLDEISGLAAGVRSPTVLYGQNDSGDSARFFALDATTGQVRGEYDVPGVEAIDWEDIAVAPDARGVPSVWLADIGDNDNDRDQVQVYRVDEPAVGTDGATRTTGRPEVWRLRYPNGPHNAEAILVDPRSHRFYLATKDFFGHTVVYQAPATSRGGAAQTMTMVGEIELRTTGTPGGPNVVGQVTVTAGSISADGGLMALRTYTDAYVWRLDPAGVAGALRRTPTRVPLPAQPLGEGVCFQRTAGGWRLLTDSEEVGSGVYAVPLPTLPVPSAGGAANRSSAPDADAGAASAESGPNLLIRVGVPALVVVALAGLVLAVRARRGRRGDRR